MMTNVILTLLDNQSYWLLNNETQYPVSILQCCGYKPNLLGSGSGSWFSCSFGSESGSGSGSEQNPNKFGSGSDLNFSNFIKIKGLTDAKMILYY